MATFKKSTARKTTGTARKGPRPQPTPESVSRTLSESAQQIWLAGVGAFNRAQAEGKHLFEGLVKEGLNLEQTARRFAGQRAGNVRDSVESTVGQARDRAADTWDRLEKVFEDRVQRALNRLGVPGREDLVELTARVNELNAELRRIARTPAAKATKAPAAKKAAKKAAVKTTAKKPAAAKKPRAARKRLPKAAKPVAPQST